MRRISPLLLTLVLAAPFARAADRYSAARALKVGGEGGWDYVTVDPAHGLLFLPRTTHTLVVDAKTGKTVADIPGQTRNHGVALAQAADRGFITDGGDGSVTVFSLKDYKVLGKIAAADDADGAIFDPASNKVLVACGDAGKLVPIAADVDPKGGKAEPAIELGGKPEFLAVDGGGRAFVALTDKDEIAVIDTKAMKLIAKWPTAPGGRPVGLGIGADGKRLVVGCRKPQKLLIMSTEDGKIVADLPLGAGVDAAAFDGADALASCGDGTLTVARAGADGQWSVAQTVQTRKGSRTMGVDAKTGAVYLPAADFEAAGGKGRPKLKAGTFRVLVVERGAE
ncbi:MAG TPA: YncE family protein [Elusimicrobiota bacterium]|nr:YncE family protein [Elusimicrobiota bacterium]